LEFGKEEKIGDVFVEHILLLGRLWEDEHQLEQYKGRKHGRIVA
jgi:hypothetical protein